MSDTQVSFRALQLANEHRSAYGLRYNDVTRYRKHCANRTHRLRSTLKMTHGKGREFKKLAPLTTDTVKDGHVHWAYAQDLIAQSTRPANEGHAGTLRHSATGRFRRSVHWATQLLSHCQALHAASRLSTENLVQAIVYTLILNWSDALVQLSVARYLLDELADRADTSRDQALATLYCAHELGREKAYDVDAIGCESIGSGHGEARKKLQVLMWEGQPVPVRNPELVDVLLKVQEAEAKISVSPRDAMERQDDKKKQRGKGRKILSALSDAEEVARKLVEAQQSTNNAGTSAAGTRDVQFVHAYIVFQLLSRRIQRDLLLVSALLSSHQPQNTSKKEQQVDGRLYPAVVKLLETVVQSLTQMRSPECSYLAQCYVAVKRYAEAMMLIQHATLHLRETRSTLSTIEGVATAMDATYDLSSGTVDGLDASISGASPSVKKEWFAYNGGTVNGDPKAYQKPLFFDIALNYVQLDMDRLLERAGKAPSKQNKEEMPQPVKSRREEVVRAETPEPPVQTTGGLSALLGGWWGRK
ncbi:hypothetical protein EDC04DRAFT_2728944 [Pisolithus marmoratus]|nr:hypothetical protein EDC04DRAFT_2728944 [Pisolithus marmoratus]